MIRVVAMCMPIHACYIGSKLVVSLRALELGASPLTVGVLAALYATVPLALGVYSGRLADRIGMRAPILAGTAFTTAAMLCGIVGGGLGPLFVTASLAGTGFVFFNVSIQNLAGAVGTPEQRARNFSILSIGYSISTLLGPMAAGFVIDAHGHAAAFVVFALVSLIPFAVMAAAGAFVRAYRGRAEAAQRHALDLLRVPKLRRAIITSGLTVGAWELYGFYLPVYAHAIGLKAGTIGLILGAYAAANFVSRFAVPLLARRFTAGGILAAALTLSGSSFVALPLVSTVASLALLSFAIGLGLGVAQPLLMTVSFDHAPPGRTGEMTGLRLTANNVARVAIPLLAGATGTAFGVLPVFWMNAVMLLALSRFVRN